MVTDEQVRRLRRLMETGTTLSLAAAKAGMDEKTARKYRRSGRLASELQSPHTWRTREDPFAEVWEELREKLTAHPGLEAKTLFEDLQRRHPGRYADGQLRTLQRRLKAWRATEGPGKEVFFAQEHRPGELCESDFTHLTSLGLTIAGRPFAHMVFHFVLTYSNWEAATICVSECFESLAAGLGNALADLGGVPKFHRTDRMSTAVHNCDSPELFTARYRALLAHYGLAAQAIQAGHANENGDVEQRHHRFKRTVEQALLMRGSRDFASREAYEVFVRNLVGQLNAGRRAKLAEEVAVLRPLPARRFEAFERLTARVGQGSTIRVKKNTYSVPSRLIGERVEVHLFAETVEVWYGQKRLETMPRLRGRARHAIDYRHVIDWLVRKPGAFAQYRFREDLFPTSRFRIACDALRQASPARGHKEYLAILQLAARENEAAVDEALRRLIDRGETISLAAVEALVRAGQAIAPPTDVEVAPADLAAYDALLTPGEEEVA